jgi:hypothetical protein
MLASLALQHLSETLDKSSVSLLHYFCDFANRKEQTKESTLKSFFRQIITQGQLPVLQAIADSRLKIGSLRPPSAKDLLNVLDNICSTKQFVVVIDGPDELENAKDLKNILGPFITNNCRILVSSRDLPEIRSVFQKHRC